MSTVLVWCVKCLARRVERIFFDLLPLPLEPQFHHRGIDRGQHRRLRDVGDVREVIRPLPVNTGDGCECGQNGLTGSPAFGCLAVSG